MLDHFSDSRKNTGPGRINCATSGEQLEVAVEEALLRLAERHSRHIHPRGHSHGTERDKKKQDEQPDEDCARNHGTALIL